MLVLNPQIAGHGPVNFLTPAIKITSDHSNLIQLFYCQTYNCNKIIWVIKVCKDIWYIIVTDDRSSVDVGIAIIDLENHYWFMRIKFDAQRLRLLFHVLYSLLYLLLWFWKIRLLNLNSDVLYILASQTRRVCHCCLYMSKTIECVLIFYVHEQMLSEYAEKQMLLS